ncbi:MAG: hypothetical protein KDK66_00965 [Deltaproteobacteria bacterium]|nr:hypothetical protein [Deltaproteobacteria bacterium]
MKRRWIVALMLLLVGMGFYTSCSKSKENLQKETQEQGMVEEQDTREAPSVPEDTDEVDESGDSENSEDSSPY